MTISILLLWFFYNLLAFFSTQKRVSDIAVNALYNAGYRTQYRVGPSSIIICELQNYDKKIMLHSIATEVF